MVRCQCKGEVLDLSPSKIICLLRNYAAHATEMKNEIPDRVRFFLKPPSSLLEEGGEIVIPEGVEVLHHEVELALLIGKGGFRISGFQALDHVKAFGLMLDITARDIQDEAKRKGLPWSEAKGYDTFAPVGRTFVNPDDYDPSNKRIWLSVNGEIRQDGNTDLMLFKPQTIISEISKVMSLEPGDLILTGTPAGVGKLVHGDIVKAGIEGIGETEFHVIKR